MFASQIPELILRECPDRRQDERFVHRESVQVDGRFAAGRDISASGIAVVMRGPVAIGDVVYVTTSGFDRLGPATTPARVARIQTSAERLIVGLQFVRQ